MTKKKFNIIFFSGILFFFLILLILERKSDNNQYANLHDNLIIATYIDGEFSDNMPSKDSGYDVDKIECNKDINVKWDYNKWSFAFLDNLSEVRCNIYFKAKTVYEYDYTGNEQTFTVPLTGVYKLETWGAAGGSISLKGGNGAYSKGYISLNKDDILYVNVGGTTNNGTGGYNGGGTVTNNRYGGGGATHIATKSGLLNKFENNQDDILIVSGGGGGEGNGYVGGAGGGIIGVNGNGDDPGRAGSQTAGGTYNGSCGGGKGTFGKGGSSSWHSESLGGGGSGYYGGSSGGGDFDNGSGGGGSSYIGNHLLTDKVMYCYNCTESNEENTKTMTTTCSEETPTENCAKKGNGYAKMTFLGISLEYYVDDIKQNEVPNKNYHLFNNIKCENNSSITWNVDNWILEIKDYQNSDLCKVNFSFKKTYEFAYTGAEQNYTVFKSGIYKLESWGAQGGSTSSKGGTGAYSTGTISLNKGDKLYINVGSTTEDGTGGYNGGGSVTNNKYGGGGATHIATTSGLLSSLANTKENILIVSAGGGGEGNGYVGGAGGGIIGVDGNGDDPGKAGSQSSGGTAGKLGSGAGTFGQGGSGSWSSESLGGGGGGYYGGSSGGGNNNNGSGGGGSGYIANTLLTDKAMYCYNCTESSEESTKTISTTCNEETPTENCAKKGNGYVKITFIEATN